MLKKVKPVLDTSYKPYVSDGNQEEDTEPEFYRTDEEQLVLKKVAAFYNKVPMPCKPVPDQDPNSTTPTKPSQKRIPDIEHIILLKIMQESGDYKAATALVGVDLKYTSKTFVRAQIAVDSQLASLELIKHAVWKPTQSTSQSKIPPF
ncbi:hypothetical protein DSO57_1011603 [Entomophthora muscae]|uniref:Uncharacterized protein n=1 Tax=Entomophthora muscae TaxID=34485 RepID=A0ACC2UH11_9FUNG|nr:hypothetical protein DSO57_1011603 [Entomophthora muscae]